MLIHSSAQFLTLAGAPQRGHELGRLGLIEDGALLFRDGRIIAIGSSVELRSAYPDEPAIDASGCVVMPGFVDPHTHLVWAGDRAAEFDQRVQGKSYLDILQAGGGILSTVRATRAASTETLLSETRLRLQSMFQHGTTTAEAKTGYCLELSGELRLLQVLLTLAQSGPLELVITFLPAHAIPSEYREQPEAYTNHICQDMLPTLFAWWQTHQPRKPLPFVDVFCEDGAFSLEQSRTILLAAKELGFPLKIHADEFANLGGAALAVELGAVSADHLVATSQKEIVQLASSSTVAVALPCTPFGLGDIHYIPAKAILEADGLLALATDLNPGTAWCGNMQFAIALACRYMHLTPAQAIAAATINAAAAINCQDKIGSLEVDKQADVIILDIPDYRHLGYRFGTNLVKTVVKNGQVFNV